MRVERVETNVSSVTTVSSRACSNMAYDEVVVLACTSLVFLCFVRARKVWVKDYLKKTRDFWMLQLFANVRLSESQSDLVNYMRIDIEMFEELFSPIETQN